MGKVQRPCTKHLTNYCMVKIWSRLQPEFLGLMKISVVGKIPRSLLLTGSTPVPGTDLGLKWLSTGYVTVRAATLG